MISKDDIIDSDFSKKIYTEYPEVLDILLYDNTTKKNIIWASDHYAKKGKDFLKSNEIKPYHILGRIKVIKPRTLKSKTEQVKRSKDNAEVFTPSWIVNKQNNLIDNEWFKKENVFNIEKKDNTWTTTKKIIFDGEKTFVDYIDDVRLEICCGEAPYLVSRYDSVTGESIKNKNRIGLLDRKFRVINENIKDNDKWIEYSLRAIKSIYGYEFQGDNLFIARENILLDFIDYYFEKFNKVPDKDVLIEISTIISWNIFQMDGIKYVVPFTCHNEEVKYVQLSLFEDDSEPKFDICPGCKNNDPKKHNGKRCYIMDWQKNKKIKFVSLMWGNDNYVK